MVMKEKESIGVPVPVEKSAEMMVPVATRDIDHCCFTLEKVRESVTAMELDHHKFPNPSDASAYTHLAEKWEHLPLNKNHGSSRHDSIGRLFENLKSACSEL